MSRLPPVDADAMPEIGAAFQEILDRMGLVPMAQRVMARNPALIRAFQQVAQQTFNPPEPKVSLGHCQIKLI